MKKFLIPVLLLLLLTLMVTACSPTQNQIPGETKTPLNPEQFRQMAEAAGYEIQDMEITAEDQEIEPGLTICIVFYKGNEDGGFQAGHYKVFDTEKNAIDLFAVGKADLERIEKEETAAGKEIPGSSAEGQNFAYCTRSFSSLDPEPIYAAASRIGETIVDVSVSIDAQEEMVQFLQDLGYIE